MVPGLEEGDLNRAFAACGSAEGNKSMLSITTTPAFQA